MRAFLAMSALPDAHGQYAEVYLVSTVEINTALLAVVPAKFVLPAFDWPDGAKTLIIMAL